MDSLIISDRIDAYWKFSLSPSARILVDSPLNAKIKKEKKNNGKGKIAKRIEKKKSVIEASNV